MPGLAFDAEERTLAGSPEVADEYRMTYRVEDSDANTDPSAAAVLAFLITVEQADESGNGPPSEPGAGGGAGEPDGGERRPVGDAVVGRPTGVGGHHGARVPLPDRSGLSGHVDCIPDSGPGRVNHAGFTVAGLTNDTTYAFQVRAIGSSGASGPSNEATVVPAPGICDRTPQVVAEIVEYLDRFGPQLGVTRVSECGEVTAAHLAAILALDLTNRRPPMTALKRGDFAGLTSIEGLYLHGNALTALPDGLFAGLSSLESLALYNNDLEQISAATFVGLPALDSLQMKGNALGSLADGTFAGLPSLTALHLGDNGLTDFRPGILSGLSSLEELYLWDNEIAELSADTFTALTALTRIELQYNRLQQPPAGLLSGLASLAHLYLEHNGLTSVPAGLFAGLTSLVELRLFLNELENLPAEAFAGLASLKWLYLSDNRIAELPAGAFEGLASLAVVDLSDNAVDPVPLPVALEAAGTMQFKATAASGAPFEIVLPVVVTHGSLSGGANTVTIPKGDLESAVVAVDRTPGTTGTITVEIGDLPALPSPHRGYALVKGRRLSL